MVLPHHFLVQCHVRARDDEGSLYRLQERGSRHSNSVYSMNIHFVGPPKNDITVARLWLRNPG